MREKVKSFAELITEVQIKGLCHRCGGCVTFCSAINYGALELGEGNRPHFKDPEKCIECGLCYVICPEITELEAETKRLVGWNAPMGCVLKVSSARSVDPKLRKRATDGGAVTGLLVHLLDTNQIDGAIVSKQTGPFSRMPWLATSREEIIEAAGTHFDESHGLQTIGEEYRTTFSSSIQALRSTMERHLHNVAVVGTPCQIHTLRRMEALNIVPSDIITYYLGLFCTKNFVFNKKMISQLEKIDGFKFEDVEKINIKKDFLINLKDGRQVAIPLDKMDFMTRLACRYCTDYSAEYADISFGGIASPDGWTTVISRTPLGRAIYIGALGSTMEEYQGTIDVDEIYEASDNKKASADRFRNSIKK